LLEWVFLNLAEKTLKKNLLLAVALLSSCSHFSPHTRCNRSPAQLAFSGLPSDKTVQAMLQEPMLINSRPADPEEWPASVYAHMENNAACSATLVGERVLLIASHCVQDGGRVSFAAHANNYTARCSRHPFYEKNLTADWTLCLVERPVTGVLFESIGVNEKIAIGDLVTLSGYGCTHLNGGGGNDGIFRIGTAAIEGLPYKDDFDVVTRGGAALCFGDSGGSAYLVKSDKRVIFGVNSRGDIHTTSYLPWVASETFLNWARDWARNSNNVRICGIHEDALYCRNDNQTQATIDKDFEVNSDVACVKGTINPSYLRMKSEITSSVLKALDQFEVFKK
jgi:hypothetical protein